MIKSSASDRRARIEFLFPIVLFLVFALSAITVILFAARVYREEVTRSQQHYTTRTSLEYLTQKIHRSDMNDAVYVSSYDGHSALVLLDRTSDAGYETIIYCADGFLRELYTRKGSTFDAGAGSEIIALAGFDVELINDHLIRLSCTDQNQQTESALVQIRSTMDM